MSEDRVVEALKALRDADAQVEAGPQVEIRIMQAARRRRARRVWIGAGTAGLAAAAAVVMLLHARRAEPLPPAPAPKVVAVAEPPAPSTVAHVVPKPRSVRRKPRAPREVMTEFYPLVEVAQPFARSELRRVTVPASTMRDVGLFVNATHLDDPVQADVLIGEQGLAIRFVSYQY